MVQAHLTVSNPDNVWNELQGSVICHHSDHLYNLHLLTFTLLHVIMALTLKLRGWTYGNRALLHYLLVWLALISSPIDSVQMDAWLLVLLTMDALPLILAVINFFMLSSSTSTLSLETLMHCPILDSFSAALQMHRFLIQTWNGDFGGYVTSLILIALVMAKAQVFFGHLLYCKEL